jgi:hypothetical protein
MFLKNKLDSHKQAKYLQIAIIFLLLIGNLSPHVYSETLNQYQTKAIYLFNLALFLTWPNNTFQFPEQPFRICILGKDPFGIELDIVVENEKIENHQVVVPRISTIEMSRYCQILFINQSEQDHLTTIFAYLSKRPILTISDINNFIKQGGMIQLFNPNNNQVHLIINPNTIKQVGIKASANLLEIAKIINSSENN